LIVLDLDHFCTAAYHLRYEPLNDALLLRVPAMIRHLLPSGRAPSMTEQCYTRTRPTTLRPIRENPIEEQLTFLAHCWTEGFKNDDRSFSKELMTCDSERADHRLLQAVDEAILIQLLHEARVRKVLRLCATG